MDHCCGIIKRCKLAATIRNLWLEGGSVLRRVISLIIRELISHRGAALLLKESPSVQILIESFLIGTSAMIVLRLFIAMLLGALVL
jgi:hypothetical protein